MSAVPKAKIEIDVCEEHGVWLDHGELGVLVLHIRDRETARSNIASWQRRIKDKNLAALIPILFD